MAADTYTTGGAGLFLMGTGNDVGTWGSLLNSNMIQIAEDAVTGTYTSSATGGTLDLSGSPPPAASSQSRFSRLFFNGTLTSNLTIIVPNLSKWWFVENSTAGAFSLLIKTTAGTATQIPQGTIKIVRCDGGNGMRRLDSEEVGQISAYGRPVSNVPNGMLECNGAAISRVSNPDLFAAIGTIWGAGDGSTTFNLPLLTDTGRFLRSRTGSVPVGTYQANQNLSHTHTGTTDATNIDHTHTQQGSFASGIESAAHTHIITYTERITLGGGGGNQASDVQAASSNATSTTESANHTHVTTISGQTGAMSANASHTHTFTTGSSGGSEARPEAAVVFMCIRY